MAIDPNVQVALVSVLATTVTTLGVVLVAVINNRKERQKSATAGVDEGVKATLDEKDVLGRILVLMNEVDLAELANKALSKRNRELQAKIRELEAENLRLRDQTTKEAEGP